jgi:hypothetical protein
MSDLNQPDSADHVQDAPQAVQPVAEAATTDDSGPQRHEESGEDESNLEIYKMNEDLFLRLTSMGFSENAVKKSIVAGCIDEKTCQTWIEMQLDHPELNTPLEPHIRVKILKKRVLTDQERAAKVEELKAKIAENKRLEKEQALKKESDDAKRRMNEGKAVLHAKEEREAIQRKLDYEQRRKEKEDDRIAKEKIQVELAVDRLVRGGMDPAEAQKHVNAELEEKKRQLLEDKKKRAEEARLERERKEREGAAGQEQQPPSASAGGWDLSKLIGPAESEAAGAPAPRQAAVPVGIVVDFDRDEAIVPNPSESDFINILTRSAAIMPAKDEAGSTGRVMLRRVLQTILDQPLERKVRVIKVTSNAFTQKILPMPLSCLYLRQAGFQEAASSAALEQIGASDQLAMHACILPKVRKAVAALDSFAA